MIELPTPPPELAAYVAACSADDPVGLYLEHGAALAAGLVERFPADLDLTGRRVLDFGCGSGRFLRHLVNAGTGAAFEGADIDAACVAWLARHLPPPHGALRNDPEPPLPRPDGHYALVYATSVFSHLTDSWAPWLCELHRLLEDDGVLIATVIDQASGAYFDEDPWDDDRIGMLVLGPGRPWVAGGPMVLHSEWWIRAHWGRAFEVVDFHPGAGTVFGQAVVVMRKRAGAEGAGAARAGAAGAGAARAGAARAGAARAPAVRAAGGVITAELLERLEPDEPREVSALAHQVRRSQAENVVLNRRHDEYSLAYAAEAARCRELERENADLTRQLAESRADLVAAVRASAAVMTVVRAVRGRALMVSRSLRRG